MNGKKGFTLLEVLIVVGIIAALVAFGLPRIRKNNNNIKSTIRELATLSKEIRHYARLKNCTYRIVFTIGTADDGYYVESSSTPTLVESEEKLKAEEGMSADDRPKSPFHKVDRPLKEGRKLPPGLSFKLVETKARKEPVEKGTAYIHYSAEGLVEQSVIQLTDGKNLLWTLTINPLTGHAEVYEKAMRLKDLEIQ